MPRSRLRWALQGASLAMLLASCNGGEHRSAQVDAGSDVPVGPGDAGSDRPYDGGALEGGSPGDGGGTPGLPVGTACTQGSACASGFCADGVCCNAACDGLCVTCAAQGSVGTCLPADVGTDPRNDCADQGIASCGTDGVCDGTGACRKYSLGVALHAADVRGIDADLGGALRRQRRLRAAARSVVRAVRRAEATASASPSARTTPTACRPTPA